MEVDPPAAVPSGAELHGSEADVSNLTNVTDNQEAAMTDHPTTSTLKRSNSAPMLASTAAGDTQVRSTSPVVVVSNNLSQSLTQSLNESFPRCSDRIRRYSASSTTLFSPGSGTPVKNVSRLAQLINEETRVREREVTHERETRNNLLLSTSCEELSLSDPGDPEPMITEVQKRPRSFQEPLHIFTSPYPYASSPSPTRIGKQCFSPSLCQPVPNALSPSPSPTRKSFKRRSISPISMAPTRLMLKRKINMDHEIGCETPNKKFFTCISPGYASTPNNSHPLSISSSSFSDNSNSPVTIDPPMLPRGQGFSLSNVIQNNVFAKTSSQSSPLSHNNVRNNIFATQTQQTRTLPNTGSISNNNNSVSGFSSISRHKDRSEVRKNIFTVQPAFKKENDFVKSASSSNSIHSNKLSTTMHHQPSEEQPPAHSFSGLVIRPSAVMNTSAHLMNENRNNASSLPDQPPSMMQLQQQSHQQHSPMISSPELYPPHHHFNAASLTSPSNVSGFRSICVQDSLDSMSSNMSSLSDATCSDMAEVDSGSGLGSMGEGELSASGSSVPRNNTPVELSEGTEGSRTDFIVMHHQHTAVSKPSQV